MKSPASSDSPAEARPLYLQVKERIIRRLLEGVWRPGTALPNEFQLAAVFEVSQGTVRKALDELAQEKIVTRHQGKGTFVAEHRANGGPFHFFRLVDGQDEQPSLYSTVLDVAQRRPTAEECHTLHLPEGDDVVAIRRLRHLGKVPAIVETIAVSARRFPSLAAGGEVPNTLYIRYQARYGVTVVKTVEHLAAVAAGPEDATALGIAPGTPLLEIDRVALALDGEPVEWRLSRCLTQQFRYLAEVL